MGTAGGIRLTADGKKSGHQIRKRSMSLAREREKKFQGIFRWFGEDHLRSTYISIWHTARANTYKNNNKKNNKKK